MQSIFFFLDNFLMFRLCIQSQGDGQAKVYLITPEFLGHFQCSYFFLFKLSLEKKINWETPAKLFSFLFQLLNCQLPILSEFFI